MIIKNNFDSKRALPINDDYKKIGKGSNNIDKKIEEKDKINPFYKIENNTDRENDEDEVRDKWDFFK